MPYVILKWENPGTEKEMVKINKIPGRKNGLALLNK
jgi:hypothetical protein